MNEFSSRVSTTIIRIRKTFKRTYKFMKVQIIWSMFLFLGIFFYELKWRWISLNLHSCWGNSSPAYGQGSIWRSFFKGMIHEHLLVRRIRKLATHRLFVKFKHLKKYITCRIKLSLSHLCWASSYQTYKNRILYDVKWIAMEKTGCKSLVRWICLIRYFTITNQAQNRQVFLLSAKNNWHII